MALLTISSLWRRIVAWTGTWGVWVGRLPVARLLRVSIAVWGLPLRVHSNISLMPLQQQVSLWLCLQTDCQQTAQTGETVLLCTERSWRVTLIV